MAEAYHHNHKSEWVCVDEVPETYRHGSTGNQNGGLLYTAELLRVPTTGDAHSKYSASECAHCIIKIASSNDMLCDSGI